MKYTFYRPNELNTTEFDKIISDMHDVLVRISNGYADGNELKDYLEKLIEGEAYSVVGNPSLRKIVSSYPFAPVP
jgi:hypothetical protein